jgi:hypothetical protein
MSYYTTRAAYGTTGVKTITCGFQPVAMRITVSGKGSNAPVVQLSTGTADGTRQNYEAIYWDGSGGHTKDGNTKIISQWERVAGTLTEVVAGTFDSFTATEGKFNLSAANNNYALKVELWD